MNCSQVQARFPELLDERLSTADTAAVRAHLASCPDCQRDFATLAQTQTALDHLPTPAPSPRLRANFYALLEEEKNSAASIRASVVRRQQAARLSLLRWILSPIAAAAVAFGGFYFGARYGAPAATPSDAATKKEIAELRAEMNKMGEAFVASLIQQRSTTDRLQNVLATLDQRNPNQKVISDLIGSLALDPSVNVRLSALDALYPHASQQLVRDGVLATFPREQNPLVKVAMIDFFVAAGDRAAAPELEKLARDETIDRAVREAAKRGLAQL